MLALIRAADTADWGEPDFTEEGLRYEWGIRDLDLSTDTWLIERDRAGDPNREACGYGWLMGRMEHRQLHGWIVVHPAHRGRGIEEWLLDLAERRADEHATLARAGATVLLHQGAVEPDRAVKALLASRGYGHVRISWQMRTSLEPPLATPVTPDGVEVRTFDPERDARAVHAVTESAFADHWGWVPRPFDEWAELNLVPPYFDPALWFVVVANDQVVGASVGGIDEGVGWVHTLGVLAGWRGRGIGECLLRSSFAAFAGHGVTEAALDVDAENATGAVALYERVGMRVFRRYDTFERRLVGSGEVEVEAEVDFEANTTP